MEPGWADGKKLGMQPALFAADSHNTKVVHGSVPVVELNFGFNTFGTLYILTRVHVMASRTRKHDIVIIIAARESLHTYYPACLAGQVFLEE